MQQRRKFLKQAGTASLALAASPAVTQAAAADRIRVGVIGPGGMGMNHVRNLVRRDDVEIVALCDVDRTRLNNATEHVTSETKKKPATTGDLRRVLDDRSIDAVFIATPDHWHAPAAILALDAGKHVYVEKPCCHNIREGRLMADAVKRSRKVLQVGTQSRSTDCVADGIKRVLDGEIGDILVAKAWNSQRRGSIGHAQPTEPPSQLDFDTWTGPAKKVPYQKNLLHSVWRWWYAFGCGDIGNDGVHDIDVALWGLGVDTHPNRAACFGNKLFFDDDQQFPDTQYAVFDYKPDGNAGKRRQLIFEQRDWAPYTQEGYENGAAFYGTNGVLIMGHTVGWRLYGPRNKLIAERTGRADLVAHHTNFFDSIRGKATPNASIEVGHRAATIVHLANIAARTGHVLEFDPATERVLNYAESDAMTRREYRDHWGTPEGVTES
ncbi:MAG: Gfo/Idh/MocA family protein [Planctomycetota bacterium]|jgi:predicted dehydrogenase